jgi:6-phosphogluconolactonase/glucosamine-6-phosphate isomerase/deaminase
MSNLTINRFNSREEAAAAAGEALNQYLTENLKNPVLLLLSGGSALSILDYVGPSALSENLSVCVLDERFSEDPIVNNFSQLQKTEFYAFAFEAGCSFFGTLTRPNETAKMLAQRWQTNLQNWLKDNPTGKIFATLGMGADGHTAGIFPMPENPIKFKTLFQSDSLVAEYDATGKTQLPLRITTTLTFLAKINHAIAFVCGMGKKEKLEQVLAKQGKINELPALAWHKISKVEIYTDLK